MVSHSRAPVRVDRLRSLNLPRRVVVEVDGRGFPCLVKGVGDVTTGDDGRWQAMTGDGVTGDEGRRRMTGRDVGLRQVEAIGEVWRVDDEWWRRPIARRYVEVLLEGGAHVTLYEDLTTGEWFVQRI